MFAIGVDLGQRRDFSAVAVVERGRGASWVHSTISTGGGGKGPRMSGWCGTWSGFRWGRRIRK